MSIGYMTGRAIAINILDLGAKCDGITDDTIPLQAAVDLASSLGVKVVFPGRSILIRGPIYVSSSGLVIEGAGMHFTRILVDTSFLMSANGIFDLSQCSEPGPVLRDFSIVFQQPDTNIRTNLVQFPPAIYAPNVPRFQIRSLKIERAWNGIVMTGNSGGVVIDDLQISMFNYGVWIDGSEDTVRISKMHCWDFGLTSKQSSVFNAPGPITLYVGRVDGLFIDSLMSISNLAMKLFEGTTGAAGVFVSSSGFDTYNGIQISAGEVFISSSYFSIGDANAQAIVKTGGMVHCAATEFNLGVLPASPMIVENSATTPESMAFVGCFFVGVDFDQSFILIENAEVLLTGCKFSRNPNVTFVTPAVSKTGGRLTAIGCAIDDQGSGTSTFFDVSAINFDYVVGNVSPGRPSNFPIEPGPGHYDDGAINTGSISAPAIPASGTAQANPYGAPARIFISGGAVSDISINGISSGLTSGMFLLMHGETLTLTYTSAPNWDWFIYR